MKYLDFSGFCTLTAWLSFLYASVLLLFSLADRRRENNESRKYVHVEDERAALLSEEPGYRLHFPEGEAEANSSINR